MLQLSFKSDAKYLRIIRASVKSFLEISGYKGKDAMMIVLAVDEAICNIIRHGYNDRTDGIINFEMSESEGKLYFRLRDYGKKSDPKNFKSRKLDNVRPGGLGVFLMQKIMDEIDYDTSNSTGTLLTMVKKK